MDLTTIILQLLFGWAVRKWPPLKNWSNRLIPVMNAILAAIVQAIAATTAHAADSLAVTVLPAPPVHHGHPGWFAIWVFLQPVILNTLVSSGLFSSVKNVRDHIKGAPHND